MFVMIIFMTGMTGNWVQHTDYFVRNDIFYDLTTKGWPPFLDDGKYFVYYFQSWLPAALVGRYTNWEIAQWTYFVWSLLGMFFVLYYVYKALGSTSFWISAAFLTWAGLELLPCSAVAPWTHGHSMSFAFSWNNHVAEPLVSFYPAFSIKSIIHCLIPLAIVCGMLLQKNVMRTIAPILAVCALMYSPMGAVFLLPILIYLYLKEFVFSAPQDNSSSWCNEIINNIVSPINVTGYLCLIVLIVPYYLCADSASPLSLGKLCSLEFCFSIVIYMFFNMGIAAWIIYRDYKNPLMWVVIVVHFFCMLSAAAINTDMAMKGSIVTHYFLFILFCKGYTSAKESHKIAYILYMCAASLYFIHMTGAFVSVCLGVIIFIMFKLKIKHFVCCFSCGLLVLLTTVVMYPRLFDPTLNKLAGKQTKYNKTVGIYQKDGGRGKWWWYKTFPDREKMPLWFK